MEGMISDIQKFSLHDGPGIRTTVFLKGCNMHCAWCHNPETLRAEPDLMFFENRCIRCGACYQACKTGALRYENGRIYDADKCRRCGDCAGVCAPKALTMVGRRMTVDEVMHAILLDLPYYFESGGGVTVSGGEPLMQAEFTGELLKRCKQEGIPTAMESNLSLPYEALELVLPYLDRLYCDVKLIDDAQHVQYTGVSNRQTLSNIRALRGGGLSIVVRTPMIPGVTDSEENVGGIAAWLKENAAVEAYELLNYNPLAQQKAEELGRCYTLGKRKRKTKAELEALRSVAARAGIPVIIGGD